MTAPAVAINKQAGRLGIRLEARGDRLRVVAPRGVPADLRRELVEHKAELLAMLAPPPPTPETSPSPLPAPRDATWDALARVRWGPAIDRHHDLPGIVVDTPDRARMRAAVTESAGPDHLANPR